MQKTKKGKGKKGGKRGKEEGGGRLLAAIWRSEKRAEAIFQYTALSRFQHFPPASRAVARSAGAPASQAPAVSQFPSTALARKVDFELAVSFLVRARLQGLLKTLPSTSCWSCLLEFSWNDVAMPAFLRYAGG